MVGKDRDYPNKNSAVIEPGCLLRILGLFLTIFDLDGGEGVGYFPVPGLVSIVFSSEVAFAPCDCADSYEACYRDASGYVLGL